MAENLILPLDTFVRSVGVNLATQHALFLGAGASVSSGVPSAKECIWEWKRSILVTKDPNLEGQLSELSHPSVQSRIQKWLDQEGIYPSAGSIDEYEFYIEQCYPSGEDRRAYFQGKIRSARPYVGYRLLAHLAQDDLVRSVWTTNFDRLTVRASADFDLTPIEVGIDCQDRLPRVPSKGELLCISLHGDYRYDLLKNTREELQTQETELRRALIEELRNTSLIVTGYSGRDQSVMEALKDAYTEQGTGTLYWCGYGDDDIPEHIADLIRHARTNGRRASYVHSQGFDDLMERLALYCLDGEAHQAAKNDISRIETQQLTSNASEIESSKQWRDDLNLKNSIEHLGHENDSVRIGGAYELFHLAENTEELRQTIFNILCTHIRQTTSKSKYRETYPSKPSEEVQSLLTLLFVQEHEIFRGLPINLEGSWLNGADLKKARLAKVILTQAHLRRAELVRAHLQGANLHKAQLQGAFLAWAELQGAFLNSARLKGAALAGADLQGAKLDKAQLQGAKFFGTQLQGVTLSGTQMQGAEIVQTHLQAAALFEVQLQGAKLDKVQLQGANSKEYFSSVIFESRIRSQIKKISDLSGAIFAGGLSQEDVDSFVEDLPDAQAKELRKKLTPHIGQPESNQLPENSDAITGSYTEEDAEKWIAEYEKATSEVPEDNS